MATIIFFFRKGPSGFAFTVHKCNYRHFPSLFQREYNVMLGYTDQNVHSKTYHLNTPIITPTHMRTTDNQLMYVAVQSSWVDIPMSTEQTAGLITHTHTHKIQFQISHFYYRTFTRYIIIIKHINRKFQNKFCSSLLSLCATLTIQPVSSKNKNNSFTNLK